MALALALCSCTGGNDLFASEGAPGTVRNGNGTMQVGCPSGWSYRYASQSALVLLPPNQERTFGIQATTSRLPGGRRLGGDVRVALQVVYRQLRRAFRPLPGRQERRVGHFNGQPAGWFLAFDRSGGIYVAVVREGDGWTPFLIFASEGSAEGLREVADGFRPLSGDGPQVSQNEAQSAKRCPP
jgi:hypothetical protein